jgi:two-component system chemotaxis sensor kinase CheA
MTHDPYKYFRIEARDLLDQLGQGVLDLEKAGADPPLVAKLLRLAHTLKGAARVVRRADIGDLAHAMEEVLSPLRDTNQALSPPETDRLLALIDRTAAALATLDGEQVSPKVGPAAREAAPDEAVQVLRADVSELDGLLDGIAETHVQLEGLSRTLGSAERIQRLSELLNNQLSGSQRYDHGLGSLADGLRSDVEALSRELSQGIERIQRELRQVRERAERLRLLPARTTFTALERTARDAAQTLGKTVRFEARGGEVRLDAQVLAIVQSALVQAVRNAVAHGIESASERVRAGKPETGRVTVEVLRSGARIVFRCHDDGAGIDEEAVRRALARRGVAIPGDKHGGEALLELLFRGGVSTSKEVTEVAGRGIGLDLVRDAATRLGGELRATTERGRGTTLELEVRTSLSSLDALVVEASGRTAALPLDAVHETLRIPRSEFAQDGAGTSIVRNGKVIPFVPLARALGARQEDELKRKVWSAVLVGTRSGVAALGVERLCGTKSLVLRPLPPLTPADPLVLGAALDGAGNPELVLDPEALVRSAGQPLTWEARSAAPSACILVIDDSLTTRMLEQSILESAGYEVDLAASAEEGLERARSRAYALFLVDVEMPGMDGFGFVRTIRSDAALRDIPAILVTSRSAPEDKQQGALAGAQGYVVKGEFDQIQLLERIRTLIGGR